MNTSIQLSMSLIQCAYQRPPIARRAASMARAIYSRLGYGIRYAAMHRRTQERVGPKKVLFSLAQSSFSPPCGDRANTMCTHTERAAHFRECVCAGPSAAKACAGPQCERACRSARQRMKSALAMLANRQATSNGVCRRVRQKIVE